MLEYSQKKVATRSIRPLDDVVINRIAAGEVVTAPSAVVKELLENALDAMASFIELSLGGGGIDLIEVRDDGLGIAADELTLSVTRHATSKIISEEDLETIHSFGFRGEALCSIASVARLEITSLREGEKQGARLIVEGGGTPKAQPHAAAPGTVVRVTDLFFAHPARRKFLKSPAAEFQACHRVFKQVALAHPEVRFQLNVDGKPRHHYPRVASRRARLLNVFEGTFGELVLETERATDELSLHALHTPTHLCFSSRRQQYFFINGRPIQDANLSHAVQEAYRTLLMDRKHAGVVLFLELDPSRFDVNVHPSKSEVKWRDARRLHHVVRSAIRETLLEDTKTSFHFSEPKTGMPAGVETHALPLSWPESKSWQHDHVNAEPAEVECRDKDPESDKGFGALKIIGQFARSYLVCQSQEGLVLIDQHAAHERVLFERFRKAMTNDVQKQRLLNREILSLTPQEANELMPYLTALAKLGFELEPFGDNDFILSSAPAFLQGDMLSLCRDVIGDLVELQSGLSLDQAWDSLVETMACKSAIRFNKALSFEEMRQLLRDLDATEGASNCPHGRPVFVTFSHAMLERQFKRSV